MRYIWKYKKTTIVAMLSNICSKCKKMRYRDIVYLLHQNQVWISHYLIITREVMGLTLIALYGCISYCIPWDVWMALRCLELGCISLYIPSDLNISLNPRDVPWDISALPMNVNNTQQVLVGVRVFCPHKSIPRDVSRITSLQGNRYWRC